MRVRGRSFCCMLTVVICLATLNTLMFNLWLIDELQMARYWLLQHGIVRKLLRFSSLSAPCQLANKHQPPLVQPLRPEARDLRVFVYDLPEHLMGATATPDPNREFERQMPRLIRESPAYTSNASEAHLFYVPAQLSHFFMRHRSDALFANCEKCKALDAEIVSHLNQAGPYFKRHRGADHIITSLRCPLTGGRATRFEHAFPFLWGRAAGSSLVHLCLQSLSYATQDRSRGIHMPYYVDYSEFAPTGKRRGLCRRSSTRSEMSTLTHLQKTPTRIPTHTSSHTISRSLLHTHTHTPPPPFTLT
jgi:hypothetical protein